MSDVGGAAVSLVADDALWVWTILGLLVVVGALLTFFAVVRFGWRLFRSNEELEPGGSMGRQLADSVRRRRK